MSETNGDGQGWHAEELPQSATAIFHRVLRAIPPAEAGKVMLHIIALAEILSTGNRCVNYACERCLHLRGVQNPTQAEVTELIVLESLGLPV